MIGGLSYSSPIFISNASAWITSMGSLRTSVSARSWGQNTTTEKHVLLLLTTFMVKHQIDIDTCVYLQLSAPSCSVINFIAVLLKILWTHTHIHTHTLVNPFYDLVKWFCFCIFDMPPTVVPALYMSPVLGWVRNGMKSSV